MKIKCFFELNKEKLEREWDLAGMKTFYYIMIILSVYLLLLLLTILIETYKVFLQQNIVQS